MNNLQLAHQLERLEMKVQELEKEVKDMHQFTTRILRAPPERVAALRNILGLEPMTDEEFWATATPPT